MATSVTPIERLFNGVTLRATQPRDFFEDNQWHEFEGKRYFVPLTKKELMKAEDKAHCITTFITDMMLMFYYENTFNQDISSWDVSNVTTMVFMFAEATSFNQDISSWDVSQVTNMSNMFAEATSFNQPLNSWDMSNVKYIDLMFHQANAFNQPLDQWDVSNIIDMNHMFHRATSFNQDISSWNVSNVTYMDYIFKNAFSFNQDTSTWWNGKVTKEMLEGTLWEYIQQRKEATIETTKRIKEELIQRTWHPSRVVDWCFTLDEKEEISDMN